MVNVNPERGRKINEHASQGMRLVRLRDELPNVEKAARKTPHKSKHAEIANVRKAQARLQPLREEIARLEASQTILHVELTILGAFGPVKA